MTELRAHDGTWRFDFETIRLVPARNRGVHKLRQRLGELSVPLAAVATIAYEPGRKGGRVRLRLRDGADPLVQATGGRLPDSADPYQLAVDGDRGGVAEFFVDEVRNALAIEATPAGSTDRYLLPSPSVPVSVGGSDGTATFDGKHARLDWNWLAEQPKKSAGPRDFALDDLLGVEWNPGYIRFRPRDGAPSVQPSRDPNCLELWGFKNDTAAAALLAAAVVARLPHPSAVSTRPELAAPASDDDLVRRLRELADLHREGVLTDEEFAAAKEVSLRRFRAEHPD